MSDEDLARRVVDLERELERLAGVEVLRPEAVSAYHSANQSIATATWTPLAFDSERYDTNDMHDTAVNNTRLTCRVAGKYMAAGGIYISGVTNTVGLQIRLNGTTYVGAYYGVATGAGDATRIQVVTPGPVALAVGDYLELCAFQSSGSAQNVISAAQYSPYFGMWRVG